MSFLASIQEKKKKLSSCTTIVTQITGEKFEENIDATGERRCTKIHSINEGYVVDLKPDLQVAHVLPHVCLGSQDAASDIQVLNENGVTHVLSLGVHPSETFSHLVYKWVDLLDIPEEDLASVIPVTNSLLDAVQDVGRVLVHCNAGCSRAPAVVIAYLMYSKRLSYEEARCFVGDKRYIRPNDGFVKQLQEFKQQNHFTS